MTANYLDESKKKNRADGWHIHEYVDPATAKAVRRYTYKGKSCTRKQITSRLGLHMAGYALIEKDLRSCLVWLDEIERLRITSGEGDGKTTISAKNREIFNIVKALYVAMITFYGKCFTSGEGRLVKLERSHLDEKYRYAHDQCMIHRHNFTAHSGGEKVEICNIALVYPTKYPRDKVVPFQVFTELMQPDSMNINKDVSEFGVDIKSLLEHARDVALEKQNKLFKKLMEEEVIPKNPRFTSI